MRGSLSIGTSRKRVRVREIVNACRVTRRGSAAPSRADSSTPYYFGSNNPRGTQSLDICVIPPQLAQYDRGMLPQCWDVVHARRKRVARAWRQQRRDRTRGSTDLDPATSRPELRMPPHVVHVVHLCVPDTRLVQARYDLIRGERCEHFKNDGAERVA